MKQTENIFSRFGPSSLLVAKYIPGFSTVAPPLAGTMGVGLWRFLAYSAGAAALWASAPVAAGFFFSAEVEWLLTRLDAMGTGALTVVLALILTYVAAKAIERHLLIRFLRMVRITAGELRVMIDEGREPVILDVRSSLAREAEPRIIRGAISVDLGSAADVLDQIPADRDVVVYCS